MDNRKGEKGKLFFTKYFIIIYNNKIYISMYKFVIVLVMDNEKVNVSTKNIFTLNII
jgi:hypothetical protein